MNENKFYSYETCSDDVKKQICEIVDVLSQLLKGNLLGLYLQGSLVFGAFDDSSSDIDMIGVVHNPLSPEEKIELGYQLLSIDKKPCPIEVVLFVKGHLTPWQYPPVCNFYFSDYFSKQYNQFLLGENLSHRLLTANANTTNSTPCLKLTKEKGIRLYGMAADELIGDIPDNDIWDAISSNLSGLDPASDNGSHRLYAILTLCRILSYKETGKILSKQDAAFWAMDVLPDIFSPIISNTLFDKYELGEKKAYPIEDAISFKSYILKRIL